MKIKRLALVSLTIFSLLFVGSAAYSAPWGRDAGVFNGDSPCGGQSSDSDAFNIDFKTPSVQFKHPKISVICDNANETSVLIAPGLGAGEQRTLINAHKVKRVIVKTYGGKGMFIISKSVLENHQGKACMLRYKKRRHQSKKYECEWGNI